MKQFFAGVCVLVALAVYAVDSDAGGKAKQNQMVKGTIKSVDTTKNVLIVNQQVKKEFVDRELTILDTTKFIVIKGSDKKEQTGSAGLALLEGAEGSQIVVKCDKDVNVLQVNVQVKKK